MFRHKGDKRTYRHNFKLASLLSFVAAIVNTTGLLPVKTLTTNVGVYLLQLHESILLKAAIINCFFSGCVPGGYYYHIIEFKTLLIAALILLSALLYELK